MDALVEALLKCPRLQSVKFSGCNNETDASAEALSKCPQLQSPATISVFVEGCIWEM